MEATVKVFPIYAAQVLNLGSLSDDLESELGRTVDPANDEHLRHVIRKMVAPYFERWDDQSKLHLQRILALGLLESHEQDWFVGLWEGDLAPFDLTDPPHHFFELLYEELFGDRDYDAVIPDINDTELDFDPTACNSMRVAPSDAPDLPPDLLPVPSQQQ